MNVAQSAPEQLPGHRFGHLCYVVNDIQAACEHWATRLGIETPQAHLTPDMVEGQTRYCGHPTPGRALQVQFQAGDLRLELLEPVGAPTVWKDFLDRRGDGQLHHLGYWVDDYQAAIDLHVARGSRVTQTGAFTGGRYAFLEPADGATTVIEILARVDDQ